VALHRLTDRQALAALARSHPDWRIRKAAVDRLDDRATLTAIAAEDKDADVREAALAVLDAGRPQPGTPPERIRALLADPALVARHGKLDLETRVAEDERYVREDDKGKVLWKMSVAVRRGDEVLFEKTWGRRAGARSLRRGSAGRGRLQGEGEPCRGGPGRDRGGLPRGGDADPGRRLPLRTNTCGRRNTCSKLQGNAMRRRWLVTVGACWALGERRWPTPSLPTGRCR
jgi:hypothetical protein